MSFSIIIPAFNASAYLERSVNSVFSQGLKEEQFEVIIVNDGSTDETQSIAEKLKINQGNIRVFSQQNKGLGGARNTGIKNSTGEFVIFLDADDIIAVNSLQKILSFLPEDFDILELSSFNIGEDSVVIRKFIPDNIGVALNGIDYYLKQKNIPSVCNKIYRNSFLKENNLFFKEQIFIEDFEFNTRAFFLAKKIVSKNILFQNFIQTENSITRNNSESKKRKLVDDNITIMKEVLKFKNSFSDLNPKEVAFFNDRLARLNVNILFQSIRYKFTYQEFVELYDRLQMDNLFYLNFKISDTRKELLRLYFFYFPIFTKLLLK